ncbi:cardiolipin synthase [Neorhodopirellula pilleata]|uniref:Cardiolipin synthase n=1 Tax=Neorhodopirellula pilleata TaxID=2714738 RepID=A0A5C6A3W7_9BACT|nr:cardiolipin synthase [Neorhodopirellula pilleata]TWT93113.1 putative cardiolipin synthase YwiE [Neorhodopirellula pilleata]
MDWLVESSKLTWTSWGIAASILLIHVAAFFSAFHSLQHVRTSQAAVAWVVGLITLPYLSLPMYWIFARHRFEGYREAIREVGNTHERSVAAIRRELTTPADCQSTNLNSPLEHVADVLDTPISEGNEFRLLIDGDAFFDTLVQQIQRARRYVYAEFYILRDDEVGKRFADALIERAREGVVVRLLYDEVGCLRLPGQYVQRLLDAGVDVHAFNTRQGWVNRLQINFRNHRKLVVVDGRHAVIGGLNIGDEYRGKNVWKDRWRDSSVAITGQATRKIQAVFAGDYYWAARTNLPEADWGDREPEAVQDSEHQAGPSSEQRTTSTSTATDARGRAAVCTTGPADIRPRAAMMFAAAIQAARSRLWISTPYLIPDESLMVALSMAKARGVDVRVLIPAVPDEWPVFLAGYHYEHELAELGIPVFRYYAGMLHQKAVLIDDSLALIGSTNLDNRSLYLNFELMIAIEDSLFIDDVAKALSQDFRDSRHSNHDRKPLRPWFARAGTAVARLFSPVL